MKVSFVKPGSSTQAQPVAPAIDVESVATPTPDPATTVTSVNTAAPAATPPPMAVATTQPASVSRFALDSEDAPINIKDIIIPRLSLVQRVGDLSTKFPPESIVLDRDLVLAQPVSLVLLGFLPDRYVEKVEGGVGGQVWNTEAEVHNSGGTLDYNESKRTNKVLYQTLATALILVKQPVPGTNDHKFPLVMDNARWVLAQWGMKGSSYTKGAKVFRTARSRIGWLSKGYVAGLWSLKSKLEKYDTGNVAVVPVPEAAGFTSPEFQEWAKHLFD